MWRYKNQQIETEIRKDYRIATLSTLYLAVSGIIMPSLKSLGGGQFQQILSNKSNIMSHYDTW